MRRLARLSLGFARMGGHSDEKSAESIRNGLQHPLHDLRENLAK